MNPLVAAGVALAVAAVAVTAASIEQELLRSTSRSVQEYAGPVDAVDLDLDSGDVQVVPTGGSEGVVVERTESWSFDRPAVVQEVVSRTLRVRADCSALFARCSVSYVVRVPTGTRLVASTGSGSVTSSDTGDTRVETGSGDVTLMRVDGRTTARAGSGEVTVLDVRGDAVSLRSGSGDVVAQGVSSPSLVAGTGSGDVVLFLDEAEQVQAESGSGDVEVRLPLDGEAYDVRADTGSGDRDVQVSTDPDSPRTLRLRTGSGDIRVAYGVPLSGSDPPR